MIDDVQLVLTLPIPVAYDVVSADIAEGLSTVSNATVVIATTSLSEVPALEGADAVLVLTEGALPKRRWTLLVDRVRFAGVVGGAYRYELRLRPRLGFLAYVVDTRKFRQQTTQQIAESIFVANDVATRWELTRDLDTRKYTVQYRESSLAFVSRLLELEGIFYTFDDDGTLVLGDHSASLDEVMGQPVVGLIEAGDGMVWTEHGLSAAAIGARVQSGAATVNDHNWKKPKMSLLSTVEGERDTDLEVYDYPVGYRRPDQGDRLARTKTESLRVGARYLNATGNVPFFRPGRHFTFAGSTVGVVNFVGRYLLLSVTHHYRDHRFDDTDSDAVTYHNESRAIPSDVPFRPAWTTPHPEIAGSHTAMVRGPEGEEIHTDQYGRFRAQFHWDREAKGTDDDSRWLRVTQETQSGMVLARVGWEHSVAYINGDPDRPLGFARNINGEMTPRYAQPANKTRMAINTPTYPQNGGYNEIRLEDMAGAEHFDWRAERTYTGMVQNDRVETVGGNETRNIQDSALHSVDNNQTRSIGGNLTIEVSAEYPVSVSGDRKVDIGGNEKYTLGSFSARTEKDDTETIGGNWQLEVGREDKGALTRDVSHDFSWDIGGNHAISSKGNVRLRVDDKFTEKIGGDLTVDVSDGGSGGTVTGEMKTEIAGNVTRKAKDAAGNGSENANVSIVGDASFSSDERLTMRGERIRLEATNSIKLAAADISIELKRSGVEVKGKMKLEAASQIVATGTPMNIAK